MSDPVGGGGKVPISLLFGASRRDDSVKDESSIKTPLSCERGRDPTDSGVTVSSGGFSSMYSFISTSFAKTISFNSQTWTCWNHSGRAPACFSKAFAPCDEILALLMAAAESWMANSSPSSK